MTNLNNAAIVNWSLFLFVAIIPIYKAQNRTLNIGVLFTRNNTFVGYEQSAAALLIAQDRIWRENLLPNISFNFIIGYDDALENRSSGLAVRMILEQNVSAIIGPCANLPAVSTSSIAYYYNVPIFPWGLATSRYLEDETRFPTVATLTPGSYALGVAVRRVMLQFGWTEFAFVYSVVGDTEKCDIIKQDITEAISDFDDDNVVISFTYEFPEEQITTAQMAQQMKELRSRARIFVVCLSENLGLKRDFMLALKDADMLTDEFVYVMADTRTRGYVSVKGANITDVWLDVDFPSDGRDAEAHEAFKRLFILTDLTASAGAASDNATRFGQEVIARMSQLPFNCTTRCSDPSFKIPAVYAGQLHDALYLYAYGMNKTLARNPMAYREGATVVDNAVTSFDGMSGHVIININGTRVPDFFLLKNDDNDDTVTMATINVNGASATFTANYDNEAELWWNRKGNARPLTIPICGLKGDSCPLSWNDRFLAVTVASCVVGIVVIIMVISGLAYLRIRRIRENARLNAMWEVPFAALVKAKSKAGMESMRSLQSGPSTTSTKQTIDSKTDSVNYGFYVFNREPVVANKFAIRVPILQPHMEEMRMLRQLDSDNLNRFIGMSSDGPQMMSVWKYCSRGSLKDVIVQGKIQLDSFFIFSILRDIANGISYIHHSPLSQHGNISSESCLVDDRWQVKLSYYGLMWVRTAQRYRKKDLLWTSPELLRADNRVGTQEGDVYSFAIVASEVITKSTAWDMDNRKERAEELLYMIKKGGDNPPRPILTTGGNRDVNPAMLHLVRDCWAENPADRPKMDTVKSLLKSMHSGRSDNLMDHVFNMLENYAGSLEEEVEARTRELVEEQKKSDILLYRMLPRQVAEKLKLGQSVEPESFESVTIFFSDVVKFTNLAFKCSPLQVVNLLNDMYTIFDGIIDDHDVYKVETIGDGYLCVSGLPHRNGTEHIREIADLSLCFLRSLVHFRVPHLPAERINLRIGIHTGSCVAGVVGLTMPRYCLFGDTVNTASRMESNGKPGHIHVSYEANRLLTLMYPSFRTEPRGEVIIKGKGVMETYWLLDSDSPQDVQYTRASVAPQATLDTPDPPKKEEEPDPLPTPPMPRSEQDSPLYRRFIRDESQSARLIDEL